jgi:hypothetical protein
VRGRDTPHPHYVIDRHLSSSHPIDTTHRGNAHYFCISLPFDLCGLLASSSPHHWAAVVLLRTLPSKILRQGRVSKTARRPFLIIFRRPIPCNLGELQVGEHQQQLPPCLEGEGPAILLAAEDGARVGWTGGGSACPLGTAPRRVLPPSIGGRGSGGGIQCSCCS